MEQQQEKQDLLHTVRELTRQVQLQNLVIESFVPPEEVAKLERRAVWDEDGSEQWRLLPLSEGRRADEEVRPKSDVRLLRPTSFLAREVAADLTNNEPRFRGLNVLSFDLDMPERTTADYEAGVTPNVRAALTAALKDDEQLELAAEENLPSMGVGGNGWQPGNDGHVSAGLSASVQAAKLSGRTTQTARRSGNRPKTTTSGRGKKRSDDDDLDALLGGSSAKPEPSAAEQFPTSRGMGNLRRGKARM